MRSFLSTKKNAFKSRDYTYTFTGVGQIKGKPDSLKQSFSKCAQ